LLRQFAATVDGQYQTLGANDGAYNREHFFKLDPELQALVAHMSPSEIDGLRRGGHDFRKLYAAFAAASRHRGEPTVILAKTKKGFGMGGQGESRMTSHQQKKLDLESLKQFRDRFALPLRDEDLEKLEFLRPPADSAEMRYLHARRAMLGGFVPTRRSEASAVDVPPLMAYAAFAIQADGKAMSTTMAAVRLFSNLLRDKILGPRIVPIVADEARTFGMANLFRQIGIYSPAGQLYEPEDAASLLSYREARDGQILEEGITEAGAMSSWVAAATAYSVHATRLLPFYIFYSMFGFQRVGDLIWAAADQRSRGFLFGATAGRTTLGGEGLQHQDGSSHVMAATVPNCRAYDPAFAGELAVIIDHGARRMLQEDDDVFYYVTVMNESYGQPSLPEGVAEDVIRGLYRFRGFGAAQMSADACALRLLGSGAILLEVIGASELLLEDWQLSCEVWSVTSFSELAREAALIDRWNRLHPQDTPRCSHVRHCLGGSTPIVAASDYVRAYPQLISPYLQAPYSVLGTDGFGRSDTRAALRRFFEVDRQHIAVCALQAAATNGVVDPSVVLQAIECYGIETDTDAPWTR
jgi:pyruvate dehydrogenase E1 component